MQQVSPPNWAVIVTAITTVLALVIAITAAEYSRQTNRRAVAREYREQASQVAFWGEIHDSEIRLSYINTSGLPIWNVSVMPVGAAGVTDTYTAFVLPPSENPIEIGPVWRWQGGPMSQLLDYSEMANRGLMTRFGLLAHMGAVNGSWTKVTPSEGAQSYKRTLARMRIQFEDVSGVRWSRSAAGELKPVRPSRSRWDAVAAFARSVRAGVRGD